jgi:hypothetical protein
MVSASPSFPNLHVGMRFGRDGDHALDYSVASLRGFFF